MKPFYTFMSVYTLRIRSSFHISWWITVFHSLVFHRHYILHRKVYASIRVTWWYNYLVFSAKPGNSFIWREKIFTEETRRLPAAAGRQAQERGEGRDHRTLDSDTKGWPLQCISPADASVLVSLRNLPSRVTYFIPYSCSWWNVCCGDLRRVDSVWYSRVILFAKY